jgi:hypothetical protein
MSKDTLREDFENELYLILDELADDSPFKPMRVGKANLQLSELISKECDRADRGARKQLIEEAMYLCVGEKTVDKVYQFLADEYAELSAPTKQEKI